MSFYFILFHLWTLSFPFCSWHCFFDLILPVSSTSSNGDQIIKASCVVNWELTRAAMFVMAISLASVTTLRPMWDTKSVAISTPIRYVGALKTSASINEVALEAAPAKIQPDVFNKDDNAVKKNKLSSSRIRRISRKRNPAKGEQTNEMYLGYETWSPVTAKPKVNKPRSVHTAATLAYLGDCIFELYARRHFLFPPLSIDMYNERVKSVVRCEGQDTLLKKLLEDDYLTDEERDILRWGKNNASSKARTRKHAGMAVYTRASSLETLIGHLYLTDTKRLEDVMSRLGFSAGSSNEKIVENQLGVVSCSTGALA